MASGVIKDSSETKVASEGLADMEEEEEEEEEDLFEIDLHAIDSIPPPHYCESYFTSTTPNTLLANCLLPISDVSSAIPMASNACNYLLSTDRLNFFMVAESISVPSLPGKLGIPFPYTENYGMEHKELSDILSG